MNRVLRELLERYPKLEACSGEIDAACRLLISCYEQDGTVYLCGNGGSAGDAEHIVGDQNVKKRANRIIEEWKAGL